MKKISYFGLLLSAPWLVQIVDIVRRNFHYMWSEKLLFKVLFTLVLGAIIFYILGWVGEKELDDPNSQFKGLKIILGVVMFIFSVFSMFLLGLLIAFS